jgi:hypothetical protein
MGKWKGTKGGRRPCDTHPYQIPLLSANSMLVRAASGIIVVSIHWWWPWHDDE